MPSPIIDIIKEKEKEFDKEFGVDTDTIVSAHNGWIQGAIKSFHRATILAVLNELDREVEGLEYPGTGLSDRAIAYNAGHSTALEQVRAKLSEAIKELGE